MAVKQTDEQILSIVDGWNKFRENIVNFHAYECEVCYADLTFESVYQEGQEGQTPVVSNFSPDEVIFVTDAQISPKNEVVLVCPYGDIDKTFTLAESELVMYILDKKDDDTVYRLSDKANAIFEDSFKDCPEINKREDLEGIMTSSLAKILENSDAWLKERAESIERERVTKDLKGYGMF